MLLTAPAAFGPGIPPERYFHGGWVGPGVELEPKHQRYAAAVRRVAADQSIVLVDCARLIPPDRDLFLLDGYHPNRLGHRAIAALIVVALRADRLVARKMQPTW